MDKKVTITSPLPPTKYLDTQRDKKLGRLLSSYENPCLDFASGVVGNLLLGQAEDFPECGSNRSRN